MFKRSLLVILITFSFIAAAFAQETGAVLSDAELKRVVPTSFYYVGQSAPTQMRNTAAVRFAANRFVIAGLVDTSGYSTDIQAKYQGFFITDSRVAINGTELQTGAYGFGFSEDKMNIFDIGGNSLLSVSAIKDSALKRPRPLMMMKAADGVRLYSGRSYVTVTAK